MGREWENDESLLWANHHGIQIFHPQICRLKLRIITNDEQLIHHPHPQTTDWRMVTSLPPWVTRVTRVDPQVPVLFCMVGIRKGVEIQPLKVGQMDWWSKSWWFFTPWPWLRLGLSEWIGGLGLQPWRAIAVGWCYSAISLPHQKSQKTMERWTVGRLLQCQDVSNLLWFGDFWDFESLEVSGLGKWFWQHLINWQLVLFWA